MSFGAVGGAVAGSIVGGIFGDDEEGSSSSSGWMQEDVQEDETTTKRLDISDEAIDKIVADILGSETGISDIFSKENVAGIYDGTVAAQASGDLVANLAGEIAKLRAVAIEERSLTKTTDRTEAAEGESEENDLFDFISAEAGGKIGAEYGEAVGIAVNDFFS